jgi:hypothetical protein
MVAADFDTQEPVEFTKVGDFNVLLNGVLETDDEVQ